MSGKHAVVSLGGKLIEFHLLPMLWSASFLGVVWTVRATIGFLQSTDVSPMSEGDYLRLIDLDPECNLGEAFWLVRWSKALFCVTAGYAIQPELSAGDSIMMSIFTFWLPLILSVILYLAGAFWAFDCVALAATAALLWGISLLPIPLAIVVGSGIVAYAIYKRR